MDNLTLWSLVVGSLSPLLIAVAQQPQWSDRTRALVTAAFAIVLGAITVWLEGDLDGRDLVSSMLVVLVAAQATYKGLWKPTGTASAIENATSGNPAGGVG